MSEVSTTTVAPTESLRESGYVVFECVIPEQLIASSLAEINTCQDVFWMWTGQQAETFKTWLRGFVELSLPITPEDGPNGNATLHIINRNPGDSMCWHEDEDGSNTSRIFVCCYLTPTTQGRGALKVLPFLRDRDGLLEAIHCMKRDVWSGMNSDAAIAQYPILHARYPDEILVEVSAGSIVVGDRRLVHSVDANRGPGRRTMVSWWQTLRDRAV